MVLINVKIARHAPAQVKQTVLAKRAEHVRQKTDGRFNGAFPASVKAERKRNIRLSGFSFNDGASSAI
jgi:hypothetical protein